MTIFVEARDHEPRLYLPADLVFQCVAELQRLSPVDLSLSLLFAQARHVGVRQRVPHLQLAAAVGQLEIEYEARGVDEPGQQNPLATRNDSAHTGRTSGTNRFETG